MQTVRIAPDFESWRVRARGLLAASIPPGSVLWCDSQSETSLFEDGTPDVPTPAGPPPRVPAAFMELARVVAAHRDSRRWGLLYRLLWRATHGGERGLLPNPADPDVRLAGQFRKAVARDIHKMHAFVRFRLAGRDETAGREQFVAWFEPDHFIVRLAAPFFQRRFAAMDWSILTPDECAHWDGSRLHFTPGVPRDAAPDEDALENLWRAYYKSIFNPARLKVKMMRQEMPAKYWKNLPEAPLIAPLIAESTPRVHDMLAAPERDAKPAPRNPYLESLRLKGKNSDPSES